MLVGMHIRTRTPEHKIGFPQAVLENNALPCFPEMHIYINAEIDRSLNSTHIAAAMPMMMIDWLHAI